jgi:hypothetical protein
VRLRYCLFALSALLGGCGISTKYTPLNPPPRELRVQLAADVPVIETVPEEAHVEIGSIEARRMSSSSAKKEALFRAIQKVAAEHGCDAARIVGPIPGGRLGFQAACIVYKTAPQAPRKPSSAPPAPTSEPSADAGSST